MSGVGSVVTVHCVNGERLQGRIQAVDSQNATISLERPFKDGVPLKLSVLDIDMHHIIAIKIWNIAELTAKENEAASLASNSVESSASSDRKLPDKLSSTDQKCSSTTPSSTASSSSPALDEHGYVAQRVNTQSFENFGEKRIHARGGRCWVSTSSRFGVHPTNMGFRGRRSFGYNPFIKDANRMNRIRRGNIDLTLPINFNINKDYDFDANNKIYVEEMKKDEAEIERRKDHLQPRLNYSNDENIVRDESRVQSWTTKTYMSERTFTAAYIEHVGSSHRMPFLTISEKQRFLKEVEAYIGSDIFHALVGDRLLMFIWKIIDIYNVMVKQVVVLDFCGEEEKETLMKPKNIQITNTFIRNISNRVRKIVIYSNVNRDVELANVRCVCNVSDLPTKDVQLVVALERPLSDSLKQWARKLDGGTHLVCIEQPLKLFSREHIMMIGVGTASSNKKDTPFLRPKSFSGNNSLLAIADVGFPFGWFDNQTSICLSQSFATQMLILLS